MGRFASIRRAKQLTEWVVGVVFSQQRGTQRKHGDGVHRVSFLGEALTTQQSLACAVIAGGRITIGGQPGDACTFEQERECLNIRPLP